MRRFDSITDSMDMNLSTLQEIVEDREAWDVAVTELQRVRHNLAAEQQQHTSVKKSGFKLILI